MSYRKFNIAKPRQETLKNGEQKTFWDNVGTLTLFLRQDNTENGILELHSFDQDIKLNVFPMKEKSANQNTQNQPAGNDFQIPANEEVSVGW